VKEDKRSPCVACVSWEQIFADLEQVLFLYFTDVKFLDVNQQGDVIFIYLVIQLILIFVRFNFFVYMENPLSM